MKLTSPDRLLWPAYSKADLRDYYVAVADRLLPQLRGRPLTLRRHPRGVDAPGFFHKDLPDHAPEGIQRFRDWSDSAEREIAYAVVTHVEDLHWCAQTAAVELHPWVARTDQPERPDTLVLDLDPGERAMPLVDAATHVRTALTELGLDSVVKTSGKKGLHVLVPIERRYRFDEVRGFALAVARVCSARHPADLTVEIRKADRKGRLLVDWTRNGRGQTIVAAWSPRATRDATVATPLTWDEVTPELDPAVFTLASVVDRADAWASTPRPQRLERAAQALASAGYPPVDVSPRGKRSTEERLAQALRRAGAEAGGGEGEGGA